MSEEESLKKGMEEKSGEFIKKDAEVYQSEWPRDCLWFDCSLKTGCGLHYHSGACDQTIQFTEKHRRRRRFQHRRMTGKHPAGTALAPAPRQATT